MGDVFPPHRTAKDPDLYFCSVDIRACRVGKQIKVTVFLPWPRAGEQDADIESGRRAASIYSFSEPNQEGFVEILGIKRIIIEQPDT